MLVSPSHNSQAVTEQARFSNHHLHSISLKCRIVRTSSVKSEERVALLSSPLVILRYSVRVGFEKCCEKSFFEYGLTTERP